MVINVLSHVNHCYTNSDGDVIYRLVYQELQKNRPVTISFKGVDGISSSFVNSAFIALLDDISFSVIRRNLIIINSTKQINEMIKRSFTFETTERNNLVKI